MLRAAAYQNRWPPKPTHTRRSAGKIRGVPAMAATIASSAGPSLTLRGGNLPKKCAAANLITLVGHILRRAAPTYTMVSAVLTAMNVSRLYRTAQVRPPVAVPKARFAKSYGENSSRTEQMPGYVAIVVLSAAGHGRKAMR